MRMSVGSTSLLVFAPLDTFTADMRKRVNHVTTARVMGLTMKFRLHTHRRANPTMVISLSWGCSDASHAEASWAARMMRRMVRE
jgi:hypothetical protein